MCRSTPASSLLVSWKTPAMIVPGKLGPVAHEGVGLAGNRVRLFFDGVLSATVILPLPMATMCAGMVTLMSR